MTRGTGMWQDPTLETQEMIATSSGATSTVTVPLMERPSRATDVADPYAPRLLLGDGASRRATRATTAGRTAEARRRWTVSGCVWEGDYVLHHLPGTRWLGLRTR
jgi:hypothetical protein